MLSYPLTGLHIFPRSNGFISLTERIWECDYRRGECSKSHSRKRKLAFPSMVSAHPHASDLPGWFIVPRSRMDRSSFRSWQRDCLAPSHPPVQPVWVSPPHAGVPRAALRNASPLAPVICSVSGSWGGDGVYLHTSPLLSFYVSMPQNMILGKQPAFLIRYLNLFLHEIPAHGSVPWEIWLSLIGGSSEDRKKDVLPLLLQKR